MPHNAIILINASPAPNYLQNTLHKQGFAIINLITIEPSNVDNATPINAISYDNVIVSQSSNSEIFSSLESLLDSNNYSFITAIALQPEDVVLVDKINKFFKKAYNGESFHNLVCDKVNAINQLNKVLSIDENTYEITLAELQENSSNQNFPYTIKVIHQQKILATYIVQHRLEVDAVINKLADLDHFNIKLFIQPFYKILYRLQTTTFIDKTTVVALCEESYITKENKVLIDGQKLVNLIDTTLSFTDDLAVLSQRLVKGLHLHHGISEFLLAFYNNQFVVLDYNLAIQSIDQIEIMDQVLGYNQLSHFLVPSILEPQKGLQKKAFKYIFAADIRSQSHTELVQLSLLPTYFRFIPRTHQGSQQLPLFEKHQNEGTLFLVHKNKDLVEATYASLRNSERLLSNPCYASHSATHIVDFYREAAMNKRTDYNEVKDASTLSEEKEALTSLAHEAQHIPRFVRPLNDNASIQDIMRYYIDVYDLYILHGKAPGTKIIPMNTGNPAFLPFKPIVKALYKSFQQDLSTYARYSMQVPTPNFVDKLTQYCHEEKMLVNEQTLQTHNVVIGHGSTNLYYLALKSLIKHKGDIVLITRPTYGLFIDPIYTAGGDVGFVDIKESDGWKVLPKKLDETIKFYNEKAFNYYILNTFVKHYKKFLHVQKQFNVDKASIPTMPSISGLSDIKIFDSYIEQLNAYIDQISTPFLNKEKLKFTFPPRVRAFYHMNPHNPTGAIYTKEDVQALASIISAHPDIHVIDDLAHWGVLYGQEKPMTFLGLGSLFEKTLTLISLSKSYCVAGLRAGIAIGNKEIISEMQYRLLNSSSSATLPAMIALDAVISANKTERDTYLENNSQEYFYRRNLMAVLINGIHKTSLTFAQQMKIYQLILENEYQEGYPLDKKWVRLILSGMPLVRTLTDPKGCFFHLLDISKLIGAKIGPTTLITSTDVRNAIFSLCQIDTVPGEISGNFFNYSLRLSFSLQPQQIYKACKDIHLFIGNHIVKRNPALLMQEDTEKGVAHSLSHEIIDEITLNKAFVRFYLDKAAQAIVQKYEQQLKLDYLQNKPTLNYLQNKPKLQTLEKRLTELNQLSEKLLEQSFSNTIHAEIDTYLNQNESWLRKIILDFDELKTINFTLLHPTTNQNITLIKLLH